MPKDQESLIESRKIRQMLIARWGALPSSIWKVNWRKYKNIELTERTYQELKNQTGYADTPFALSGSGARHGGLSRFPQDLCHFLVSFYCPKDGLVVDPFSGHNSRFETTWRAGRNYIGFDISHEFMDLNREIKEMLLEEDKTKIMDHNPCTITLHETDSRYILDYIKPEIADFCMTSPPFYDIEYYGPEMGQLGKSKSYNSFMHELSIVLQACVKAMKPGAYIAWEVNDFRRNGTFHPYHNDTIKIFVNEGLVLHDIIIVDYGSSFLQSFLSDVESIKIMPKQHSYIIIGRKYTPEKNIKRQDTRKILLEEVEGYKDSKENRKSEKQGALL